MCWKAETTIAAEVCAVAQKEWELVQTINLEEKAHPGTIIRARALLVKRGDQGALDLFNAITNEPDMEKARVLVESANGTESLT
jgi:hypothetical protein